MRSLHFAVLAITAITAATTVQNEPNSTRDDDFTSLPNPKVGRHDPNNLDPQYPAEVYEQLYPQFLNEEMVRKKADYADDERLVLLGAILTAEDDGNVKKANLLRRIKTWKEQSDQLTRRSLDDSTENIADTSDDSEPDAEDDAWVAQFMAGQPVDDNMLWSMPDLTDDTPDDSVQAVAGESANAFAAVLARAHTHHAIAHAHHRSRHSVDPSIVFDQSDADWATAFLNGEYVDANMIFNMTDLEAPAADEPDAAATTAPVNLALGKRKTGLQVLRHFIRAARRARCRAKRRAKMNALKKHMEHEKHKEHQKLMRHEKHKKYREHHYSSPLHGLHHDKHGIPKHWHYHPPKEQHKKHCYRFNTYFMCPVICRQQFWQGSQKVNCLSL